ncbi:MAG: hypothetical protein AAF411_25690 [Myxococcota bacterium]
MTRGFLIALAIVFIACGDDGSPVRPDTGPADTRVDRSTRDGRVEDDGLPPEIGPDVPLDREDFDGDGVCNDTESFQGTNAANADSDSDGIPDGVELQRGFDPLNRNDPPAEAIDVLRDNSGGTQGAFEVSVFGFGEDYAGAFDANFLDDNGDSALSFFDGSIAAYAIPEVNVASVESDAQTIRAVQGRTLLGYEVRFAFGENFVRACNRALPYFYNVKRSDGVLVAVERRVLFVFPEGATREDPWCFADGCF